MSFPSISTAELQKHMSNPQTIIIDIRPVEAYNGWRIREEVRGGHIHGARSLPLKWTSYIDWIEIVRSKGILPDHTLVIYGYDTEDAERVADRFSRAGYSQVMIYHQFLREWCTNDSLPMDRLQRYRQLVYPEWLLTLMEGGTPPEFEGKDYVICHGHYHRHFIWTFFIS
jgi:thiosulfate/3-mercaptopyruvate sulfurtransferase